MMGGSEPASADTAMAEIVWAVGGRDGKTGQGDTREQGDLDGASEAVAADKGDEETGRESKAENILKETKLGAETEREETCLKLRTEGNKGDRGTGRDFAVGTGRGRARKD